MRDRFVRRGGYVDWEERNRKERRQWRIFWVLTLITLVAGVCVAIAVFNST